MKFHLLVALAWLFTTILSSCATGQQSTKAPAQEHLVAFYNVENLFDTIDDPITQDEDFTPGGKYEWNSAR
ncbi:MAG: hypothetical protein ACKOSR_11840 [Flavobacteriales bacterium]